MDLFIKVKLQQEGVHRWADCPYKEVEFLKDWHRHIFHFDIQMEVFELDREVEFIIVKRRLQAFVKDLLSKPVELSCESLAQEVVTYLQNQYGQRSMLVLVLEDNENGGGISV